MSLYQALYDRGKLFIEHHDLSFFPSQGVCVFVGEGEGGRGQKIDRLKKNKSEMHKIALVYWWLLWL